MAQGFPPRDITEHRLPQTEMACCYVPTRGSAGNTSPSRRIKPINRGTNEGLGQEAQAPCSGFLNLKTEFPTRTEVSSGDG